MRILVLQVFYLVWREGVWLVVYRPLPGDRILRRSVDVDGLEWLADTFESDEMMSWVAWLSASHPVPVAASA